MTFTVEVRKNISWDIDGISGTALIYTSTFWTFLGGINHWVLVAGKCKLGTVLGMCKLNLNLYVEVK